MSRDLLGPSLVIVVVALLAVFFAWRTRRTQRERWAKMANDVAERRAVDELAEKHRHNLRESHAGIARQQHTEGK